MSLGNTTAWCGWDFKCKVGKGREEPGQAGSGQITGNLCPVYLEALRSHR